MTVSALHCVTVVGPVLTWVVATYTSFVSLDVFCRVFVGSYNFSFS